MTITLLSPLITGRPKSSPRRQDPANLVEYEYISEWQVFQILDHLCLKSTGLDGLPAWLLRLHGAPDFFQPI